MMTDPDDRTVSEPDLTVRTSAGGYAWLCRRFAGRVPDSSSQIVRAAGFAAAPMRLPGLARGPRLCAVIAAILERKLGGWPVEPNRVEG